VEESPSGPSKTRYSHVTARTWRNDVSKEADQESQSSENSRVSSNPPAPVKRARGINSVQGM
jgi:hypothetical protein